MASDLDPRYDPVFQRGYSDSPVATHSAALRSSSRRRPSDDEQGRPSAPARGAIGAQVALWALAIVLVVAGAWATGVGAVGVANPIPVEVVRDYVLPAIFSALGPWVLAVGLLALVTATLVQARR